MSNKIKISISFTTPLDPLKLGNNPIEASICVLGSIISEMRFHNKSNGTITDYEGNVKGEWCLTNEEMKQFTFTLKHDNGITRITTYSYSLSSAIIMVVKAENCPVNAIKCINIKPVR